jgi:hypothetical protein
MTPKRRSEVMDKRDLEAAGCTQDFAQKCQRMADEGRTDECLRMLQLHRAQLVVALHEAQRPIDVCDWLICNLAKKTA